MNRFQRMLKVFSPGFFLVLATSLIVGCASQNSATTLEQEVYIDARVPEEPEGIVRYCWEEPIAIFQDQGPGLDPDGHWYHPSYTAIRKARQGRWRPCQEITSERERRQ